MGILLLREQEDLFRAGLEAAAMKMLTSNSYHDSTLLQYKLSVSANSISEDFKPQLKVAQADKTREVSLSGMKYLSQSSLLLHLDQEDSSEQISHLCLTIKRYSIYFASS